MKNYKILLVGVGPRGLNWLKVIQNSKIVKLVAVCDINKKTKTNLKSLKLSHINFYDNLQKAINETQPEIILLATPPFERMRDIQICAINKLPILVEKPLATNIIEERKIVKYMFNKNLLLMVGLNFRYLPVTQKYIQLLKNKTVGKPAYAKFIYERWRDGELKYLNKYPLVMNHPMLWEQSIHHFDLFRYIYKSDVKNVYAQTWNPKWSMYKHHTNVFALFELKNGMRINYLGTWQGSYKKLNFEWRTECDDGIIMQKEQFSDLYYAKKKSPKLIKVPLKKITMWEYDAKLLLLDFINSIKDIKKIKTSGIDHLKSLNIVEACIKSSETGKKIILK